MQPEHPRTVRHRVTPQDTEPTTRPQRQNNAWKGMMLIRQSPILHASQLGGMVLMMLLGFLVSILAKG